MIWTEESAALLWRAYMHGWAAKRLADWIASRLKPPARICDAGCGVGALSLALARRGFSVTALDISKIALEQLRKSEDPALARTNVLCADAKAHTPDKPYDAMVFCFFGGMEECLRIAKRCCVGDVFYISRDYDLHRFSVGSHPVRCGGYRQACETLDALAIPYQAETFALNMGQPFESLEEARGFFALYSRDGDPALITDEFLKSRLVPSQDRDFPLYLPHMRKCGMLRFHVNDIPPMGTETE